MLRSTYTCIILYTTPTFSYRNATSNKTQSRETGASKLTTEEPHYEVIEEGVGKRKVTEKFALEECPAYVPTAALSGDGGGLYETVASV